jgi:hypothetical protein
VRGSHRGVVQRQAGGGAVAVRQRRRREYLCTGTLLNTVPTTNTPYLFTAGHCMKSAKAAHTLNTLWFFDGPVQQRRRSGNTSS